MVQRFQWNRAFSQPNNRARNIWHSHLSVQCLKDKEQYLYSDRQKTKFVIFADGFTCNFKTMCPKLSFVNVLLNENTKEFLHYPFNIVMLLCKRGLFNTCYPLTWMYTYTSMEHIKFHKFMSFCVLFRQYYLSYYSHTSIIQIHCTINVFTLLI